VKDDAALPAAVLTTITPLVTLDSPTDLISVFRSIVKFTPEGGTGGLISGFASPPFPQPARHPVHAAAKPRPKVLKNSVRFIISVLRSKIIV
jgi:hypothetical protein